MCFFINNEYFMINLKINDLFWIRVFMREFFKSGCLVFLLLFPSVLFGQLKELELIKAENPDRALPVFIDYPDAAAIIVTSSLTNLKFDSNIEVIADRSVPEAGEYRILVNPFRQTITVSAKGYIQLRFTISLSEPREVVYYELQPKEPVNTSLTAAGQGDFVLNSNPPGATISIEGFPDFNGITPYTFRGYAAQQYDVELSMENYETFSYTMKVEPLKLLNDEVNLTPKFGFLDLNPTDQNGYPINHSVVIYNSQIELVDPDTITGFETVGKGEIIISISANGYKDTTISLNIEAGQKLVKEINLSPAHSLINFNLIDTKGNKLNNYEIIIPDGIEVSEIKHPDYSYAIKEGVYTIEFNSVGFTSKKIELEFNGGEANTKEIIMLTSEENALVPAFVRIYSDHGTRLKIGEDIEILEMIEKEFVPGTYSISLIHPYRSNSSEIFVKPQITQEFYLPILPSQKKTYALSVIPGMGHIYTKRYRGWAYFGLTVMGAAFGFHSYNTYQELDTEARLINQNYVSATTENDALRLSDQLNTTLSRRDGYYQRATISSIGAISLYALSLIDIQITQPKSGYRSKPIIVNGQATYYSPSISRTKTYALSVIPGMGHIYTKRYRGWAYFGLTVVGAAFGFHSYNTYQELDTEARLINQNYVSATTENDALRFSDQLNTTLSRRDGYYQRATISSIGAISLYALSLIDITLSKPEQGLKIQVGLK